MDLRLKEEIIDKITKYFKLTSFEAESLYNDIFACIKEGVAEDNIAEITNLGEFIIKFKNENGEPSNKKTVEFLPTSTLDDEINEREFEIRRTPETMSPAIDVLAQTPFGTAEDELIPLNPVEDKRRAEEEIIRKRDEILNKINFPKEEYKKEEYKPEITGPLVQSEKPLELEKQVEETAAEETVKADDLGHKNFSDYFTEVKEVEKTIHENVNEPVAPAPPPVQTVIPPVAVDLHNQITGEKEPVVEKQTALETTTTQAPAFTNGSGTGLGGYENRAGDNSYYIWYKDSEPNNLDTQTLSYEYELLYQATKEAEYKSKLRIYVTSFILFFSVVLLLLIFSPVFYKIFFTPKDQPQNTEQPEDLNFDEPGSNNNTGNNNNQTSSNNQTGNNNSASVNTLPENKQSTGNTNTPPTTTTDANNTQPKTEQPKTEHPKTEQPKTEQPKTEQPKTEQPKENQKFQNQTQSSVPEGLVKNDLGWMDSKNNVVYVQIDGGKFAIQESAWNDEGKANKRAGVVEKLSGVKAAAVKVDLGAKGTWYRIRFGEFATIADAQKKAAELRSKEKR